MNGFLPLQLIDSLGLEFETAAGGTSVRAWSADELRLDAGATWFGVVTRGSAELSMDRYASTLAEGMFFVAPGPAKIRAGGGLAIGVHGYRGLFQVGGPPEPTGRLNYVDGCTDTLLVCPPKVGEPCLNHLHIPRSTNQTAHTHPSVRIGVILRGAGVCRTPDGDHLLDPGMGWLIPAGCLHHFITRSESLDVLAWHPDSDFGPTHSDHPMINRTIIPKKR